MKEDKYSYGDRVKIKGEKKIWKVIMEDKDYVYVGSYGAKVKKEFIEKKYDR